MFLEGTIIAPPTSTPASVAIVSTIEVSVMVVSLPEESVLEEPHAEIVATNATPIARLKN